MNSDAPDAVVVSPEAQHDLDALIDHVVLRNPHAAARLLAEIEEAMDLLASRVVDGRMIALHSGERYRRWFVHPVSIFYERAPGVVRVVRIYHHSREPLG